MKINPISKIFVNFFQL